MATDNLTPIEFITAWLAGKDIQYKYKVDLVSGKWKTYPKKEPNETSYPFFNDAVIYRLAPERVIISVALLKFTNLSGDTVGRAVASRESTCGDYEEWKKSVAKQSNFIGWIAVDQSVFQTK